MNEAATDGSASGFGLGEWSWGIRDRKMALSPELSAIYGFDPKDSNTLSVRQYLRRICPRDLRRVVAETKRAIRQRKPRSENRFRIVLPNGNYRNILSRCKLELDSGGIPLRLSGIDIDVTDDMNTLERSRQIALDTIHTLVDESPFGIYVVDADFKLVRVSRGAQKVFANVRPLLNRDFAEVLKTIWPEPFASDAISIFRNVLAEGVPYHSPSTVERRADVDVIEAYDWKTERLMMPDGRFGVVCHFYDLSERERYEKALYESAADLMFALKAANAGRWSWDLASDRITVDQEFARQYGIDAGQLSNLNAWLDRVRPEDHPKLWERRDQMRQTPGDNEWRMEVRCFHPGSGERWMMSVGKAQRDVGGNLTRIAGLNFDVTERKRQEERQELLLRELNHRVKNALTVVQGLASQTLKNTGNTQEARDIFIGRLVALAAAHNTVIQHNWESTSLAHVVENAIAPYAERMAGRFVLSGSDVNLGPQHTLGLAMLLHELCTNAVKYGALSVPDGKVKLNWRLINSSPDPILEFEWREFDGPPVVPPRQRGFGSRLIERALASDMNSDVKLEFAPTGVVCRISMPLRLKIEEQLQLKR